jgi:hypothetical protein
LLDFFAFSSPLALEGNPMPDSYDYMTWKDRRVWLLTTANASTRLAGTIVRVGPVHLNREQLDVIVQLDGGGVMPLSATERGKQWDFLPRKGPASAGGLSEDGASGSKCA